MARLFRLAYGRQITSDLDNATNRKYTNHLNDISNKDWLISQKLWFIHNSPRRRKAVLRYLAKSTEAIVLEFIEFFTKKGQVVFIPIWGLEVR